MSRRFEDDSLDLLASALGYAEGGWPVFPVHGIVNGRCTCGRSDCSSPGKHPLVRRGVHEATTESRVLKEWWRRWRRANIAVATGTVSGIVVVDLDLPAALGSLHIVTRRLPRTLTSLTGGGGLHLLYRPEVTPFITRVTGEGIHDHTKSDFRLRNHAGCEPSSVGPGIACGRSSPALGCDLGEGRETEIPETNQESAAATSLGGNQGQGIERRGLRCTTGRLPGIDAELPGVDLRADGGYILAPPSAHISGTRYGWLDPSVPIAAAPEWLREPPRPARPVAPPHPPRFTDGVGTPYGRAALQGELARLRAARVGERNCTLYRVARRLFDLATEGHLDRSGIHGALVQAAQEIGLPEREICLSVASAMHQRLA